MYMWCVCVWGGGGEWVKMYNIICSNVFISVYVCFLNNLGVFNFYS